MNAFSNHAARKKGVMAPRALWSGFVTFGLVNVPVRLYSAVHEHRLQFRLVHEKDDGPIGYDKICTLEERPVTNDEIVKAFEYKKGQLVHLADEDFEAVHVDGQHSIDLEDFVPYDEIDPVFFAHTYLVGPEEGAEKPYALLVRALAESALVGIGKFVMRNRQYLGCLRVRDGTLALEQLHFADEIDPPSGITPSRAPAVGKRELDMALSLIDSFSGEWRPEKYRDTYTDALRELVKAKVKGRDVHRAPEREEEETPDLMEVLRLSVEQAKRGRRNGRRRDGSRATVDSLSKKELEAAARELDIPGRSRMSREELAKAVAAAR
jgi:DNA end-binding protein Ku